LADNFRQQKSNTFLLSWVLQTNIFFSFCFKINILLHFKLTISNKPSIVLINYKFFLLIINTLQFLIGKLSKCLQLVSDSLAFVLLLLCQINVIHFLAQYIILTFALYAIAIPAAVISNISIRTSMIPYWKKKIQYLTLNSLKS
jgi:hypothetical protein